MTKKEKKYTGKINDVQLQEYKKLYRHVHILEVPANDEGSEIAVAYLKPVDRTLMSAVLSTTDRVQQKEMVLQACWLAGDERIKTDDELFFSAMTILDGMLTFRMAELKKN
jgi:hypothetical protein